MSVPVKVDGVEVTRADLRDVRRALRGRWGLTDEQRAKCIRRALAVVEDERAPQHHVIAAIKTLVQADLADVRREGQDMAADSSAAQTAAQTLRAILSTPQGRALLAQLATIPLPPADPT